MLIFVRGFEKIKELSVRKLSIDMNIFNIFFFCRKPNLYSMFRYNDFMF